MVPTGPLYFFVRENNNVYVTMASCVQHVQLVRHKVHSVGHKLIFLLNLQEYQKTKC